MIFDGIEEALKKDGKSLVGKVKGIFAFKVKKTDGKFLEVNFSAMWYDLIIGKNTT